MVGSEIQNNIIRIKKHFGPNMMVQGNQSSSVPLSKDTIKRRTTEENSIQNGGGSGGTAPINLFASGKKPLSERS